MADIQNALPFFDAQVRALGDRAIVRLDFAVFCPTAPVSCELEQKFLFMAAVRDMPYTFRNVVLLRTLRFFVYSLDLQFGASRY
jgi:hypothetical protein